jgi:hypothetical protein
MLTLDEVRAVFETNVFAVIAVAQAMLPLLREAPAGRIVNVFERLRLADDERGADQSASRDVRPHLMIRTTVEPGLVPNGLLADASQSETTLAPNCIRRVDLIQLCVLNSPGFAIETKDADFIHEGLIGRLNGCGLRPSFTSE